MILYLDTSALVKLYVEEEGTEEVDGAVRRSERVVTCRIAYAEARAAFARAKRERMLSERELRTAVRRLDLDFGAYDLVEITEPLVRRAGELAEKRALRGFDAVHLASALLAVRDARRAEFGSYDSRLSLAAKAEGFRLLGR